ncbi:MAG TPA: pyridoxamine 5'-phosphate oxidase family protein [Candidatus Paceibacterota bacterium]|nr:pyridoxamine 5'-phosphate oxidase family protein [Candidatus Paceibacterota bacterium]
MEPASPEAKNEALSFLANHEAGVLATLSTQQEVRARLVYYAADDAFNIYFLTLNDTRKVADLRTHSRAAFVVSSTEPPRTLQIEGEVADLTDSATLDPFLSEFVHKLMAHEKYGIPLSHLDASTIRFYRLTPTWVRWGDFTEGPGSDKVFAEISLAQPHQ